MAIIDTTEALDALMTELKSASYVALDTEFMRDHTYWPKLCLMQVAAPGIEAIIDPMAEGIDLASFYDLLRAPGIIKVLHASRGKVQRAEPVAALYTQGKVRHVGYLTELERQYCSFSTAGYMGKRSPDHADAAIWGLTELMLDPEPQPNIRFFNIP